MQPVCCAFRYLGDVIGRKKAMMFTLATMLLGAFASCLFTFGTSSEVYILISVWRFVMGVGIGGVRDESNVLKPLTCISKNASLVALKKT